MDKFKEILFSLLYSIKYGGKNYTDRIPTIEIFTQLLFNFESKKLLQHFYSLERMGGKI